MSLIEDLEIIALEMSDGDSGYFCLGHVDKQSFLDRVNGEYGEEFELDEARHTFHTRVQPEAKPPDQFGDGDNYWWSCSEDDEGAFPVTFVRP